QKQFLSREGEGEGEAEDEDEDEVSVGVASALRVMYQSLNSPGQLTKWSSNGGDPCGDNWKATYLVLASLLLITNYCSDISNNNLGNQIPYNLPPNLHTLNVARNQLNGDLQDMFGKLSALSTLAKAINSFLCFRDLSFNSLTGALPESFSSLSSATDLYLQNNQFTGTIDVLAGLPLKNLNVANNKFSGWVPSQLKNINLQKDGNSWNSGTAPPPPPGTPAAGQNHQPSGHRSPPANNSTDGGKKSGVSGGAIAGIVISILVVGAVIAFFLLKRRSKKSHTDIEKMENQPFTTLASQPQGVQEMKSIQASSNENIKSFEIPPGISLKPPPMERHKSFDDDDFSAKPVVPKKISVAPTNTISYSIADLQIATDSFSADNLVGEGSIGRVFRAQFEDGKVVAVKKINSSALSGDLSEKFIDIVSDIARLRHPNVTELVGYCCEHGQHLLVYKFLQNGSLYDFLHLSDEYNSKPLTWNNRVKIALGAARALEYLHEVCSPSVIHKSIKSGNILLDSELNPQISDCGLASLVPDADQECAPEVSMSGQYTVKSDVYGFGVTMLELLTGRKPFDSLRTRSEQSLVRWATPQLHDIDALAKMVDPALKGLYPVKSLSRFADVIALCVQRTDMSKRTVGNETRHGNIQESFEP
ncbi:hypothetical protein M8C21_013169, partial [Ambrosia artemisiifolia]